MGKTIYIKLLGEGTVVYRPVPAMEIDEKIYKIMGTDIFDPDDEEWEFLPGSLVRVEVKEFDGEKIFVAFEQV